MPCTPCRCLCNHSNSTERSCAAWKLFVLNGGRESCLACWGACPAASCGCLGLPGRGAMRHCLAHRQTTKLPALFPLPSSLFISSFSTSSSRTSSFLFFPFLSKHPLSPSLPSSPLPSSPLLSALYPSHLLSPRSPPSAVSYAVSSFRSLLPPQSPPSRLRVDASFRVHPDDDSLKKLLPPNPPKKESAFRLCLPYQ